METALLRVAAVAVCSPPQAHLSWASVALLMLLLLQFLLLAALPQAMTLQLQRSQHSSLR